MKLFNKCALYLRQQQQQISLYRFNSNQANAKSLGIIGVPFSKGQTKLGVEQAPDFLRQNGLLNVLQTAVNGNLKINDYGNLKYTNDVNNEANFKTMRNYNDFMSCNKALIGKIQSILAENDEFLTVGGDHAIGFGSVAGHLLHTPNLSLVWVDAHADINLHSTSDSGNIHGMPVSLLLKELRKFWQHANLNQIAPNSLPAKQLVYIGLRDVDPYEKYILNKLGIRAFAMDAIDKLGINKVIEMTLDALNPANKIHLSFDIDALDSTIAPSTGTIVQGGLTLREGISIVEALRDTGRVEGVDLVEFNPLIGNALDVHTTVKSSFEILKGIYGYQRGGNVSNLNTNLLEAL